MNKEYISIVQHFLERCRGNITNIEDRAVYNNSYPYYDWNKGPVSAYVQEQRVPYIKMECDFEKLGKELVEWYEIQDLMRDPETRQMIQEARFINRLKRGKYVP